jgi:protein-tyrosine sulfotransferase
VTVHEGIVVLGSPRSGTTLLRRLLDAHPDIACPGETYLLGAAARFLATEATPKGVQMGVAPGLSQLGVPAAEVVDRVRELAFGFHRDHARRVGKPRWAMKTASDSFYVRGLEPVVIGHAHVVVMVRNGLDVVASMNELLDQTGAFLRELQPYLQATAWPMEAHARAWVDISRELAGLAERHPREVTVLRYEDLVADPAAGLRRVLDAVGAAWDDSLLSRAMGERSSPGIGDWKTYQASEVTAASVGRYQALPRPALARLIPLLEPELRRHGYDVPVIAADTDAQADRRNRLAMLLAAAKKG